jgi:hypothetical protein
MDKTFRNIDVCKTSYNRDYMMFYPFNTYIAIIHIIVLIVSIALRLATINIHSYDTSKALNKIASELETANQIRIVENYMDCDSDDSDVESDDADADTDVDSNTDNETQTSETYNSKTIGELVAEATLASENNDTTDTDSELTPEAVPAAMESKSEEDSIESAHN